MQVFILATLTFLHCVFSNDPSMQVLLATRSFVGLLTTLAIAEAGKLNDDALYHVVEDLPGNETQENAPTCLDVMARNGQLFVQTNHYFVWVKNI